MKLAIMALLAALAFTTPAFAQHPGHGGHGGHGGSQRGGAEHRANSPRGRDSAHNHASERRHFDGRRFDNDYRRRYFGPDHFFVMERPFFYDGLFRFEYGGFFYFVNEEPIWYVASDEYYIDYEGETMFIYNRYRPGWHISLGVIVD
jgi:hypothetical protein